MNSCTSSSLMVKSKNILFHKLLMRLVRIVRTLSSTALLLSALTLLYINKIIKKGISINKGGYIISSILHQ